MAKPNNSIGKIKLPGESTQRPIIPQALWDGTTNYQATLPTLTADSTIALASQLYKVYISNNSGKVYLTGTTATSAGNYQEYRNSSVYMQSGYLYAYNISRYWFLADNTYYNNAYIEYYDYDDEESYELDFPSKNGTIALMSDVNAVKVPIEDLTQL